MRPRYVGTAAHVLFSLDPYIRLLKRSESGRSGVSFRATRSLSRTSLTTTEEINSAGPYEPHQL